MDEQLYQQVLLAVEVSHSPLATAADRKAAYAFSEEFKNRPDCALYAIAIYKNPTGTTSTAQQPLAPIDVYTRQHFALHVLEHYVLTKWSALPVAEQVALRTELVDLLLRCPAPSLAVGTASEPVFLKEKKVALIAAIAKRQFPQRWPEFVPDVLAIWQSGGAERIELVLMVLRSLAEDCVSSSFNTSIPPTRRKDILQGLNASLGQLFPVVYAELETQYALFQAVSAGHQHQTSKRLIDAALQMLKEFLDWLPIDKPTDDTSNFVFVAIQLLGDSAFRVAAAECLEVFLSRSFGKEHRKLMLATTSQLIDKLQSLDLEDVASDLDANVRFHRKVNDVLVAWGAHQLDTLLLDAGAAEVALLRAVLQTLCRLFAHPSLIIAEAQIVLWLTVLKHKSVLKAAGGDAVVAELLAPLRQGAFDKYFKLGSPDRDDAGVATDVAASEFDDHDEYVAFFGNFRGRLYALLRVLVHLDATTTLQLLLERVAFVYATYPAATDCVTRDRGLSTERSTAFLYHEGVTSLVDCIVKQLPPAALDNAQNSQLLHALLEHILAFATADPLLKFRQLFVLAAFAKFYARDAARDVLTTVFDVLFANISFLLPGEDVHGNMSADTITVRRRALASLVAICQAIPSHILPVLPVLCTKAQELFAADRVLDAEGVLLYEMLVLVSNSLATADERAQFVEQIVQEPLARWTSPEMTALVASPEAIVSAIEQAEQSPETRVLLVRTVKTLTTLYGIAKRAGADAFERSWLHLLPNVMALMRSLHALYEPAIKDAVVKTATSCWLLSLSVDELAQLLGGKHQLEEEAIATLPAGAKWSKWHKNIRDVVYHVAGLALGQRGFYSTPLAATYLQTSVLASVDAMEHRHLKNALAYVFLPFLKTCPPELYPTLLDPVLTHVLTHAAQRFAQCFVKASALRDANDIANRSVRTQWSALIVGVEEAKRDVAQEKMVMDLARQVMEFLECAIDAKTVVGGDTDTPKHVMNPADEYQRDFMLRQSATLPFAIGALLVHVIGWKDTLSCRKAALLGDKVVNALHSDPQYYGLLGRELFAAVLEALLYEHVGHVKEDGLKWELINLARNIYCRLTLGLAPVDECKGIDPCNQPVRPAALLCLLPRELLLSLPDVTPQLVDDLDVLLREKHSNKTQKNAFKELLDVPMLAIRQATALASGGSSPLGLGSSSNNNNSGASGSKQIEDLPEKLVIHAKEFAAAAQLHETHSADIDGSALFGL